VGSTGGVKELRVGQFKDCEKVASIILKYRDALIPRGILKRGGSLKSMTASQPLIVEPLLITCVTDPPPLTMLNNTNNSSFSSTNTSSHIKSSKNRTSSNKRSSSLPQPERLGKSEELSKVGSTCYTIKDGSMQKVTYV